MFRYLFVGLAVLYGIYMIIKFLGLFTKDRNACPECEGKGYWYGLRERELCKRCNGTGKMNG